ncbi:hypothetical protein [Allorhodopirellula heiligendammensis]|uniref:Uncharacterized protein n=1 Tax=Allorhodopirellula heiligendammensis TaxID=2714739 RepID=A0A5C6BZX8_9BACT|nr:hypothetical protein [Allorhodopirellula heiligendammensis]TWU16494.1 hypothetical protein Poly21_36990 [Allorhodopirellula heiligendammensis]
MSFSDSLPRSANPPRARVRFPTLFSPTVDLLTFGGSAVLALMMLPIGAALGILHDETSGWTWVAAILLIDVAHVYATGFRVYFDPVELRRRPWLYALTPLLAFAVGVAVYSESVPLFWSLLAYLAVFHFVRQQYGWVALYRSRENDHERWGWWVDTVTIYLATIYPLVYWHAHLPRNFSWFTAGDFVTLPPITAVILQPIYWSALLVYATRSAYRGLKQGNWNPGKDIVVISTVLCWYVGIITLNSDYAFTVTNVIIHGVPYMVLIYWYRWRRGEDTPPSRWQTSLGRLSLFLGVIWILAYAEELIWDCGLSHQHPWLFGWADIQGSPDAHSASGPLASANWLAPLLAVPQITHYVLDGFIWKRSARRAHDFPDPSQ